jgi:glutathione peroxidase
MTQNLADLSYTKNTGEEVSLSRYAGKTVLIVNTASKCGLTPQYEGLQALHEKYANKGLVVIGFPCDQFANQEPGSDEDIAEFCSLNYGVTFELSKKVDVNGANTHPIFEFVRKNGGGLFGTRIKWNFTKFLVMPDGKTVKRFAPTAVPKSLEKDIEKALATAES